MPVPSRIVRVWAARNASADGWIEQGCIRMRRRWRHLRVGKDDVLAGPQALEARRLRGDRDLRRDGGIGTRTHVRCE